MVTGENIFAALMFVLGVCAGTLVVYPTNTRDNKIKAEGAAAVYEGRAVCEKALDQWVCSIPKN